jgi:FAD synthase
VERVKTTWTAWSTPPLLSLFLEHTLKCGILQEPWLLHEFDEDFYGEELRLAIVGYIRPEV